MTPCSYPGCLTPDCRFHEEGRDVLPPEYGRLYPSEWTDANREKRFVAACNTAGALRDRVEELEGALRELVTLKDLVKHQDYPGYLARKDAAWTLARALLAHPEGGSK